MIREQTQREGKDCKEEMACEMRTSTAQYFSEKVLSSFTSCMGQKCVKITVHTLACLYLYLLPINRHFQNLLKTVYSTVHKYNEISILLVFY